MPPSPNRRLPSFHTLYHLYTVNNWSCRQIGERYGVDKKSVQARLAKECKIYGAKWPVKTDALNPAAKKAATIAGKDTVTTLGIKAEIEETVREFRTFQKEIGRIAHVHERTITVIMSGGRDRVTREVASRIEEACRKIRKGEVAFKVRTTAKAKPYQGMLPPGERTHCPRNHPYTERNTYIKVGKVTGKSKRECRVCLARRRAVYRMRVDQGLAGMKEAA